MARGFAMGGGASMIGGNATPKDILVTKSAYVDGKKVEGSMPNIGQLVQNINSLNQPINIPEGYHDGTGYVQINPDDQLRIIASNIRKNITILGVTGSVNEGTDTSDATAAAGDILSGKIAYSKGNRLVGTIASQAAKTVTPSASAQTAVSAGTYCSGNITVGAIPNQKAATTITPSASAQTAANAGTYMTGALTLGAIPNQKGATTITPSTSAQTAANAGTYMTGALTLGAIPNQSAGGAKYATTSAQTLVTAPKYITSNITLGALSQTNLAAANILRGKTITISNGSSNVWSVNGNSNTLKRTTGSCTAQPQSTVRTIYYNSSGTWKDDWCRVASFNPGITPSWILWIEANHDGGYGTYGVRTSSTWWLRYGVGAFDNNLNSAWRFTSSAVDVPVDNGGNTVYWVCYGY